MPTHRPPRAAGLLPARFLAAVAAALLAAPAVPEEAAPKDWQNPQLTGRNNLPPHATMVVCPDRETALQIGPVTNAERVKSPFYRSLNVPWKYRYAKNHADRVPDFWKPGFDDSGWDDIPVPANVEMHGYGIPIYVNIPYPWPKPWKPPFVPEDDPNNTVNMYRRTFAVPADWSGRRVLLTFDGVNSCFYCWVNGQLAGMGKDSRTPVEFDITPLLQPGENLLAVENLRWCDGSYLEDQDFWRMSGIFRDVYLWSTPEVHLRDFEVRTVLDAQCRDVRIVLDVQVANAGAKDADVTVAGELLDAAGKPVANLQAGLHVPAGGQGGAAAAADVADPPKWTAETPNLHRLLLTLRYAAGKVLEVVPVDVGFRKVEIRDGSLLVNGRRILVKEIGRAHV
jgi:beta-galactosidase